MLGCGAPTHFLPHFPSSPSPFPTSPLTSPTPQHTFLHLLSYLFPHLPSLPNIPVFSCYPHISIPLLKSVAKLPSDEVSTVKLLWRSYHVAKSLATLLNTKKYDKGLQIDLLISKHRKEQQRTWNHTITKNDKGV